MCLWNWGEDARLIAVSLGLSEGPHCQRGVLGGRSMRWSVRDYRAGGLCRVDENIVMGRVFCGIGLKVKLGCDMVEEGMWRYGLKGL